MTMISLAEFWRGLRIKAEAPTLPEVAELNRTSGGEVVISSLGARLWRSAVTITSMRLDDGLEMQARLRRLRRPGMSLLVSPVVGRLPRRDPLGTIVGSVVTVSSISATRIAVALGGLPPGYSLSVGDFLSIDVAGIPHLHQIVTTAPADQLGVTPELEVVPALRTSIAPAAAVTLVDPTYKAVLDPASVKEGGFARARLTGVSFSLVQTLR